MILRARSGAAGLLVDLVVHGEERSIPAAISRTVYRIVQEALTNVHKHAGKAVRGGPAAAEGGPGLPRAVRVPV
ncbi:hypothetical protein AB0L06_34085 [Spirillospora sp. NPDC052269]